MSRATRYVRGPGRTAPARRTVMLAGVAAMAAVAAMMPAAALAAGGGRAHRAPATRPDRHSLAVPGVADTFNNRIRVVAASTGTFYGQAMTAGDIYTVAGAGGGFSGDGGPATAAHMTSPMGVVADSAGNVVIAASGNRRVRVVAASTGSFYGVGLDANLAPGSAEPAVAAEPQRSKAQIDSERAKDIPTLFIQAPAGAHARAQVDAEGPHGADRLGDVLRADPPGQEDGPAGLGNQASADGPVVGAPCAAELPGGCGGTVGRANASPAARQASGTAMSTYRCE